MSGYWGDDVQVPKPKLKPKLKEKPKQKSPNADLPEGDRALAVIKQLAKRMRTTPGNIMEKLEEILFPAILTQEEMELAKTDRVGAIKKLYNRTGCALRDAKIVVDDYLNNPEPDQPSSPEKPKCCCADMMPTSEEVELARTKKIAAIKMYRARTNSSLKDAKERIEEAIK